MLSVTYSPSFPIVFVFDASNDGVEIPEYDFLAVTASTTTCISIRTITDTDGDVTVSLHQRLERPVGLGSIEVYSGRIDTPHGKVSVVDSENNVLIESKGHETTSTSIKIFVDDEHHPARVWIVIQ